MVTSHGGQEKKTEKGREKQLALYTCHTNVLGLAADSLAFIQLYNK